MYDLALSENGDLIFAANRDFLGVSGEAVILQRIRTRLKIPRGSWTYDVEQKIGSRLNIVLNADVDRATSEIPVFVREALDDLDDVTIDDVQIIADTTGRQVSIYVSYTIETPAEGAGAPSEPNTDELIISLPL